MPGKIFTVKKFGEGTRLADCTLRITAENERGQAENNISFIETSALDNTNVEKAFQRVAENTYELMCAAQLEHRATNNSKNTKPKMRVIKKEQTSTPRKVTSNLEKFGYFGTGSTVTYSFTAITLGVILFHSTLGIALLSSGAAAAFILLAVIAAKLCYKQCISNEQIANETIALCPQ